MALGRALAPRPRLVLLDDPIVSLNRPAANILRNSLRQVFRSLDVPTTLGSRDLIEAFAWATGCGSWPGMDRPERSSGGPPCHAHNHTGGPSGRGSPDPHSGAIEGLLRLAVEPQSWLTRPPTAPHSQSRNAFKGKWLPWHRPGEFHNPCHSAEMQGPRVTTQVSCQMGGFSGLPPGVK